MVPDMLNCVLHVERLFSSTCFVGLVDNISDVTSGTDGSVWGFVKNVVDRLQFVKNPILQAIGSSAVSGINSIKWVDYATWLSQPERARSMVLEAFLEGWLILTAVMILTWRVAKHFVLRVGAWKLYKSLFVLTLEQKPPDPAHKPVRGVVR